MVIFDSPAIAVSPPKGADGAARQSAVNITGRGSDIAFVIAEDAPIEDVSRDLRAQLSQRRGALFSAGGVSVNTGKRILSPGEKDAIRRVFEENSGLKVSRFVSTATDYGLEPDTCAPGPFADDAPWRYPWRYAASPPPAPAGALGRALTDLTRGHQRNRTQALLIRATFRSGESVHHRGDVVVLGDVNPGSEIVAEGDIVVMGALKGLPHAGASGDAKAAIIALDIASPRIRIGDCEAAAPPDGRGKAGKKRRQGNGQLSIAYTRRGGIYISPFAGRFARYTKGVPYDG